MPRAEVVFYQEQDGGVPILDWLDGQAQKVRAKCLARLARLEEMGHELRRPEADYLRDGIYELRAAHQRVPYRILYFFSGKDFAIVSHGLQKQRQVPARDIDLAIERKNKFQVAPEAHTFEPSEEEHGR